jgi:hypothetical protein
MKNLLLLIALILLTQCHHEGKKELENSDKREEFFEINYEDILSIKKSNFLSDIASDVRYIQLETGDDYLVSRKPEYYFSDSLIFVSSDNRLLVFDYNGKFIRQIGKPGRGPGEIDLISFISVLEKEQIVIIQTNWSRKLMFFSFDGTFIKSISRPPDVFRIKVLSLNEYLLYYACAIGNEKYLYILSNQNGDTISKVKNRFNWENNSGITGMVGYDAFRPFYNYQNQIFVKSMYNDTVYTVLNNKITPAYYINLGRYRLPDELRPEPPQTILKFRRENAIFFFSSVIEAGGTIFITTQNYKGLIDKNIIFNKETHKGSFLVDKSNEPSGILNDWDSGMKFWPIGMVNDNEIFMPISSLTLKNMHTEGDFNKEAKHFPEKALALKRMIDNLNETDNPILMLVKLKI